MKSQVGCALLYWQTTVDAEGLVTLQLCNQDKGAGSCAAAVFLNPEVRQAKKATEQRHEEAIWSFNGVFIGYPL